MRSSITTTTATITPVDDDPSPSCVDALPAEPSVPAVGAEVGSAVVGMTVGSAVVGMTVGAGVGAVGIMVGPAVGAAVGPGVGVGVGPAVIQTQVWPGVVHVRSEQEWEGAQLHWNPAVESTRSQMPYSVVSQLCDPSVHACRVGDVVGLRVVGPAVVGPADVGGPVVGVVDGLNDLTSPAAQMVNPPRLRPPSDDQCLHCGAQRQPGHVHVRNPGWAVSRLVDKP